MYLPALRQSTQDATAGHQNEVSDENREMLISEPATGRRQYSREQLFQLRNCNASNRHPEITVKSILKHSIQTPVEHSRKGPISLPSSRQFVVHHLSAASPLYYNSPRYDKNKDRSKLNVAGRLPELYIQTDEQLAEELQSSHLEDVDGVVESNQIPIPKTNVYNKRNFASSHLLPAFAKKNFERLLEKDQPSRIPTNSESRITRHVKDAETLSYSEDYELCLNSVKEPGRKKVLANERRIGSGRLMRTEDIWALKRNEVDPEPVQNIELGNANQMQGKPFITGPTNSEKKEHHGLGSLGYNKSQNSYSQYKYTNYRRHEPPSNYNPTQFVGGKCKSKENYRKRADLEEPEWYIEGPASQSDTIELRGFEDDTCINENNINLPAAGEKYEQTLQSQQCKMMHQNLNSSVNEKSLKHEIPQLELSNVGTEQIQYFNDLGNSNVEAVVNLKPVKENGGVETIRCRGIGSNLFQLFGDTRNIPMSAKIEDSKYIEGNNTLSQFLKSNQVIPEKCHLVVASKQDIPSMHNLEDLEAQMQRQAIKPCSAGNDSSVENCFLTRESQFSNGGPSGLYNIMLHDLAINDSNTSNRGFTLPFAEPECSEEYTKAGDFLRLQPMRLAKMSAVNSPKQIDIHHDAASNRNEPDYRHATYRSSTPRQLFTPTSVLRKMSADKENSTMQTDTFDYHRDMQSSISSGSYNNQPRSTFDIAELDQRATPQGTTQVLHIPINAVRSVHSTYAQLMPQGDIDSMQRDASAQKDPPQTSDQKAILQFAQRNFPQNYFHPIATSRMDNQRHYQHHSQDTNINAFGQPTNFSISDSEPAHRNGNNSQAESQLLSQWFSPELLAKASAGKLPTLHNNQALSLEECERNIHLSSANTHY